ncbi:MAG: ferritin-like domain-containing protein [Thermoproteota archaeon]
MSRSENKILGKNAAIMIIKVLKSAYCDEMRIFHYFWYAGINMEGIGLVTYAAALKTQAAGELIHAELLADDRIAEHGDKAPSDPAEWAKYSMIGPPDDPAKHLALRAALDRALKFEGKAVENYNNNYNNNNNLAKQALSLGDSVPYNLATTILADEVNYEQHAEEYILKSLEVK